jgi:hypothetical protein
MDMCAGKNMGTPRFCRFGYFAYRSGHGEPTRVGRPGQDPDAGVSRVDDRPALGAGPVGLVRYA